ncbi:MAG: FISUMP domain-containing protein [Prolixibacteraceae bacterium]
MKINHLYIILILAMLSSCQKPEWNNPFGRDCPKDIWTPTNFQAVQEGTTVKLTWSQPINNISGFKLTKKIDTSSSTDLPGQAQGVTQLVDATLEGGKLHIYTLVAYAGNNLSNILTATVTPKLAAEITTTAVSAITSTSLTSGGTIVTDGGAAITARGVCWNTIANPTIVNNKTTDGTGTGTFTSSITGLTPGVTYYIRAYATNNIGTAYGNQITIATQINAIIFNSNLSYGSVIDIESNIYKTIQIGSQLWMAENLKTTKYNDGIAIPLVTDNVAWNHLSKPGYCWYNNDANNKNTYGSLYNWYTVATEKLCPTGWHVPSSGEFSALEIYLNGKSVLHGTLKETTTRHWLNSNSGATNEFGFTALPGGERIFDGTFSEIGHYGKWWTYSGINSINVWYFYLSSDSSGSGIEYTSQEYGYSVRCLKD